MVQPLHLDDRRFQRVQRKPGLHGRIRLAVGDHVEDDRAGVEGVGDEGGGDDGGGENIVGGEDEVIQ